MQIVRRDHARYLDVSRVETRVAITTTSRTSVMFTLDWRHKDHDCVSNHQPYDWLLNRLFKRKSKKTSKLRVSGLCVGNSPGPVNSRHKGPVTRKMFPFDDVIVILLGLFDWFPDGQHTRKTNINHREVVEGNWMILGDYYLTQIHLLWI